MVNETKRRPKDGWRQLDFKTVICLPSPKCAGIFFGLLFIVSVVLTSIILPLSYKIIEKSAEFKYSGSDDLTSTIDLDEKIEGPVYIYLEYLDYFQNHRIYLKSKSKYQLSGNSDASLSANCEPLYRSGDINININTYADGDVILPCGLMAASFINLTLTLTNNANTVKINSDDIAWPSDNSDKYSSQNGEYIDISNPHFKVWMRNSLTRNFRKIYGKVDKSLEKGQLSFKLVLTTKNYLEYEPDMRIIISTTTRIGGKNFILGWAFLFVSALSLVWSLVFFILAKYFKMPTIKETYLKKRQEYGK